MGFLICTIVGTISHEYGHIVVAKYYGFPTTLHYASMHFKNTSAEGKESDRIIKKNKKAILSNKPFKDKARLVAVWSIINRRDVVVQIGGPLQTMLVGTLGFLILLFRNKKYYKIIDWIAVFLSLFWLRQVSNLFLGIISNLFFGKKNYFGGDEKNIAQYFNWPLGSIIIPTASIGLLVALVVILKLIPKKFRFTFICAGFFGGIFGYWFWLHRIGPIVLP